MSMETFHKGEHVSLVVTGERLRGERLRRDRSPVYIAIDFGGGNSDSMSRLPTYRPCLLGRRSARTSTAVA